MPELPEVESARVVIERAALGRRIVEVDDTDTYECRPHAPGEIRAALLGRRLTVAHRQGKSMWCSTSGVGRAVAAGPVLGLHLGMSGKIVIADGRGHEIDGGDYWERGRAPGDYRFSRFALTFADGGALLLIDPRRLGRVRLNPPVERLGPTPRDHPREFRTALARGPPRSRRAARPRGDRRRRQPLGRPGAVAGEDQSSPSGGDARPTYRLFRALRRSIDAAIRGGGVHTLSVIEFRRADAHCPRCGAPMKRGTVGGRTTWWCSREQAT